MREIDAHSIAVLEFPKVRDIIAGLTLSPYGTAQVENLRPMFDREAIELALRQSSQMRDVIRFEEAIPLSRVEDITELINKSRLDGFHLEPKQLLTVKLFLDIVIDLYAYGKDDERREKFPDIADILLRFHPKREISKSIGKAVDSGGEILSSASAALGRIRRELGDVEARLKQHLEKILSSRRKHAGWQDDVITIRDGRFVIPVLAGEFGQDAGIVHDKSHSGATLFVEPSSAIPINNKLRQLQQDERLEIDRILRELTAMIGDASDDIRTDIKTFGLIDCIHARAAFGLKIDAHSPAISDTCELNLIDARHPLLIYASGSTEDVVPLDITLDSSTQGILVTGPNTGGKTVALKTIGLLTLMAMSGIEIPADHKSRVGIYRKIYADIGDEQSLELSLSTFSSHIRNIIAAINDADENTLVLFDEIGAGTDPKEGAALAEVIILTLLARACHIIATTHYSQLKTLPLENPGLVNASLEFDRKNLQPTFRLKVGHPGSSYAIEIARRLGLPQSMAEHAAQILGTGERSLDQLIEKLDNDLDSLQRRKQELDERLAQTRSLEDRYRSKETELEKKEQELTRDYVDKLERQLREGKQEINRLVKELRESKAAGDKVKESHRTLEHQTDQIKDLRKRTAPKEIPDGRILQKGDIVFIEKFDAEGEIVEMLGKKKAKVAIGSAFMTVDTIDLVRKKSHAETPGKRRKPSPNIQAAAARGEFNPEISLRGMTVDEALEALEKFLDDAVLSGAGQVYIIHGKGTGTLRRNLSAYLKDHPAVESIRIGDWNEGGHGVTIARLKA
ncbi:MAG: endonuclease MutS2 [Candidatus Thorarchaeota archaeon]